MTSELQPQLIHLLVFVQADRVNLTPGPALRTVPFCDSNLKPQNHRVQRENTTCFPSAGQSKCEAAGLKLGRLHYCCRVAATEPAAVVFAGYEIIHISPSLRSGEIRHYFFAADYLRLPKFSLTNWCIFRENTPNFHKFVLCMVLWTEPPVLLQ